MYTRVTNTPRNRLPHENPADPEIYSKNCTQASCSS